MNDEYLKLQKQIEYELTNRLRIMQIVKTVIKYYDLNRRFVLNRNHSTAPVRYARHIICYISFSIYGVPAKLIMKHLKYTYGGVRNGNDLIAANISSNSRIHSDVENIRVILNKVLNGSVE